MKITLAMRRMAAEPRYFELVAAYIRATDELRCFEREERDMRRSSRVPPNELRKVRSL